MGCCTRRVVPQPAGPGPVPPAQPSAKTDQEIADIFARAEEAQRADGGTSGAELLHSKLPAEHWGISRGQLLELTEQVRDLLLAGQQLRNMPADECKRRGIPYYDDGKFNNPAVGPNMYQVNDAFVKPETLREDLVRGIPGLSYALRENSRQGLQCDLFTSHAWSEGLFEFTDAVVQAWPAECQGAYVCVFSNPQNLGHLLSRMIMTPQDSPFYRVLSCRPQQMLMVANCSVPIHARLWCVYEAHCARVMDVPVEVAGDPSQFATDGRRMKAASRAIRKAVEARILERAIEDASEEAASDFDIIAAGIYSTRCKKMLKRARPKTEKAMKSMQDALDVRKATCSNADDEVAIRREISGQADHINAMVCDLLVRDQLKRAPKRSCKLTWYWGQDMVEGVAMMLGWQ